MTSVLSSHSPGAIAKVRPGSIVGELAFLDGMPRSAKVWALTDSELYRLDFADYQRFAEDVELVGFGVDFNVPRISLTLQHGRTLDDAKRRLELAVERISEQSGALLRRIEWSNDRDRVKLDGVGFWAELRVDAASIYATGDIPALGNLLGGQFGSALRRVLEQAFPKKLP